MAPSVLVQHVSSPNPPFYETLKYSRPLPAPLGKAAALWHESSVSWRFIFVVGPHFEIRGMECVRLAEAIAIVVIGEINDDRRVTIEECQIGGLRASGPQS